MSEPKYLACDFSGIQRYVLGIKSAGKAQAKRLRARSFLLELFEHAALVIVKERLGVSDDDVLVQGGGGFLARLANATDTASIEEINAELSDAANDETGGEVQVSLGWGETPQDARMRLEYRKRRPAFSVMQNGASWDTDNLSLSPLGRPCGVCGQAPGIQKVDDEDESVFYCRSCLNARCIGEELTRWDWMRPVHGEAFSVQALGVSFQAVSDSRKTPDAFPVRRWIPRRGHEPLTFEGIVEQSRGTRRLAALKADVDDMGVRVGEIANADPSYELLKSFSRDLHAFFLNVVQKMIEERYPSIYTVYAGGDDLLLVGPWDVALDFAGALVKEFENGPARRHERHISAPLTLSAGVALTPYRVPIRHAVERGEHLLENEAKERRGKNSCAALDAVWKWDRHETVIGDGKRLAGWIEAGAAPRSLLHRLLTLAESDNPLRAARWAYQVGRNVRGGSRNHSELRRWAGDTLGYLDADEQRTRESAASLRYALLATRGGAE